MNVLSQEDIHQLSKGELLSLINRGILQVMNASPYSVSMGAMTKKEDIPEYKRFAHLKGTAIGIGEASRKYNIPHPTISRWVQRGFITRLGTGKNRIVFIDEADIAYCAQIAHTRPGSGKWLFNPDGTPYIPES